MSLKIIESITIAGIPGLEEIRIEPGVERNPPRITTAATMRLGYDTDERHGQSWDIDELKQMRVALDIAIGRAEQMMATAPEPTEPVHSSGFRVGQVLTGDEDLPIGTVVRDAEDSTWTRDEDGLYRMGYVGRECMLHFIVQQYGTTEIVSLP